jgi:hypothetical protein
MIDFLGKTLKSERHAKKKTTSQKSIALVTALL